MGSEALAGVGLLLVAVVALGVAFVEARRRRAELRFHAEMLDALRWSILSTTAPNISRPSTAIAVISDTAMLARSRPITGSRNEIR